MRRSTRAALISGLVFPGLGHLYLGKYLAGLALLVVAAASIYPVITATVDVALTLAQEIETGDVPLDAEAISTRVEQGSAAAEQAVRVPGVMFLLCWIIGIVYSARAGRRQEQAGAEAGGKTT